MAQLPMRRFVRAKNSTTVSLTQDELEKLKDLYQISFGSYYNPDKTQKKLDKALGRIASQQEQYAQREAAS